MTNRYTVTAPRVEIEAGRIVELDAAQHASRAHVLASAGGDNLYRTTGNIVFKRGERFGLEGELDRLQAESLTREEDPEAPTVGAVARAERAGREPERRPTARKKTAATASKSARGGRNAAPTGEGEGEGEQAA